MKVLPLAALVAAATVSALIVLDVVWNANNPDQLGPWVDSEGYPYLVPITGILHAAMYALLAAALIQSGRVIDSGRRFVRVLRWILISIFALFAGLFSVSAVEPSAAATSGVYEILANVAFLVSLITPIVLGFALIRRREFRVPAILLIAPIVLLPLTFVLQAFTAFAHPGYTETAVNLGLALLCIAASTQPAATEPTPDSALMAAAQS